jgi:hypothetical protein
MFIWCLLRQTSHNQFKHNTHHFLIMSAISAITFDAIQYNSYSYSFLNRRSLVRIQSGSPHQSRQSGYSGGFSIIYRLILFYDMNILIGMMFFWCLFLRAYKCQRRNIFDHGQLSLGVDIMMFVIQMVFCTDANLSCHSIVSAAGT